MDATPIDGFYAAFISARSGEGAVILILANGVIVGSDAGAFQYDGSYELGNDGYYKAEVTVTVPPGGASILGFVAGSEGLIYNVEFELPENVSFSDIVRINTPYGPANAKFKKLRTLPTDSEGKK